MKINVSIIIVNFNTRELLKQCLSSIYKYSGDIIFEIIVVDNASDDASQKMVKKEFSEVILIESKENVGFGRANNLGLCFSKGDYVFYLNSDTIFLNNAVKFFYDYFEINKNKKKIGVLGSLLLDEENNEIDSNGRFPSISNTIYPAFLFYLGKLISNVRVRPVQKKILAGNYDVSVDYVIGADMFMERSVALQYQFDSNIFMYAEEVDLQKRLFNSKYCVLLINGPKIIHLEGGSSKTKKQESLFKMINGTKSLFYYIKKHHPYYYYCIFRLLYACINLPRLLNNKYPKDYKLKFIRVLIS